LPVTIGIRLFWIRRGGANIDLVVNAIIVLIKDCDDTDRSIDDHGGWFVGAC